MGKVAFKDDDNYIAIEEVVEDGAAKYVMLAYAGGQQRYQMVRMPTSPERWRGAAVYMRGGAYVAHISRHLVTGEHGILIRLFLATGGYVGQCYQQDSGNTSAIGHKALDHAVESIIAGSAPVLLAGHDAYPMDLNEGMDYIEADNPGVDTVQVAGDGSLDISAYHGDVLFTVERTGDDGNLVRHSVRKHSRTDGAISDNGDYLVLVQRKLVKTSFITRLLTYKTTQNGLMPISTATVGKHGGYFSKAELSVRLGKFVDASMAYVNYN